MSKIGQNLHDQIKKETEILVQEMEESAMSCLTKFGTAHSNANQENQIQSSRRADIVENEAKKGKRAILRGKEALKELHLQQQEEKLEKNRRTIARKNALDTEAVRSSYITSLPPVKFVECPKKEETQPKVMLFDKSSLYQTEYALKENVVEKIIDPKDARMAAEEARIENDLLSREKLQRQKEADALILERGKVALTKEKSHNNYKRLLEQLDKMETKRDTRWELDGDSSTANSSMAAEEKRPPTPSSLNSPHSSLDQFDVNDINEVPVRDNCAVKSLKEADAAKVNAIGQLLRQLKEEQHRRIASDKEQIPAPSAVPATCPSTSSAGSNELIIFSDDDIQVRLDTRTCDKSREVPIKTKERNGIHSSLN